MKRKSVAFLLAFLFVMSICPLTLAHDDQKEHDADLKYAFFGDRDKFLQGDEKKHLQLLQMLPLWQLISIHQTIKRNGNKSAMILFKSIYAI